MAHSSYGAYKRWEHRLAAAARIEVEETKKGARQMNPDAMSAIDAPGWTSEPVEIAGRRLMVVCYPNDFWRAAGGGSEDESVWSHVTLGHRVEFWLRCVWARLTGDFTERFEFAGYTIRVDNR